jgi:hypothetical protein
VDLSRVPDSGTLGAVSRIDATLASFLASGPAPCADASPSFPTPIPPTGGAIRAAMAA